MPWQPERFIATWAQRVNKCDTDGVVELYRDDAILVPTFAPTFSDSPACIRAYFTHLAGQAGAAVELVPDTLAITQACKDMVAISGRYIFRFEIDGVLRSFPSRYTFLINITDETSPIVQHHSSQTPTPIGESRIPSETDRLDAVGIEAEV